MDPHRRLMFIERELRMLVDLAPQCDDLVRQTIGCLRYSLELGHRHPPWSSVAIGTRPNKVEIRTCLAAGGHG